MNWLVNSSCQTKKVELAWRIQYLFEQLNNAKENDRNAMFVDCGKCGEAARPRNQNFSTLSSPSYEKFTKDSASKDVEWTSEIGECLYEATIEGNMLSGFDPAFLKDHLHNVPNTCRDITNNEKGFHTLLQYSLDPIENCYYCSTVRLENQRERQTIQTGLKKTTTKHQTSYRHERKERPRTKEAIVFYY